MTFECCRIASERASLNPYEEQIKLHIRGDEDAFGGQIRARSNKTAVQQRLDNDIWVDSRHLREPLFTSGRSSRDLGADSHEPRKEHPSQPVG